MDDAAIHARIEALVAEEQALWAGESEHAASTADRERLVEVRVALDRLWDLLRQRRAAREYGRDPDAAAHPRSAATVEGYEQ